jgi:hypothetical protein
VEHYEPDCPYSEGLQYFARTKARIVRGIWGAIIRCCCCCVYFVAGFYSEEIGRTFGIINGMSRAFNLAVGMGHGSIIRPCRRLYSFSSCMPVLRMVEIISQTELLT